MYRIYAVAGVLFLILLLIAGFVALAKNRHGVLSFKEVVSSVAALLLLVLGTFLSCWATFAFVGGPDGRFLAAATLGYAALLLAITLVVVLIALRLLSMPANLAALFFFPAAVVVAAAVIQSWPLTLAAFTACPVLCLVVIVVLWVRRELKVLAS